MSVTKTTVNKLPCIKCPRAGIILYNKDWFGLGIDTKTGELTDFGGGVSVKKKETVIEGALREFHEETLSVYPLTYKDIENSVVMYNQYNLLIFKFINADPFKISADFIEKCKHVNNPEVSGIKWLSWTEFKNCIDHRDKLFFRLQSFLQQAENFFWLL